MCHKSRCERFKYLCIDVTKNKKEGKYRIFDESKNRHVECIAETETFE